MNLICDLCGTPLTEIDAQSARCSNCGLEYGPERLQEMRKAAATQEQKVTPGEKPKQQETPAQKQEAPANDKKAPKKQSGCGVWTLLLVAGLDLVIGTHGIVAVFCVIILIIMLYAKKK